MRQNFYSCQEIKKNKINKKKMAISYKMSVCSI